MPSLPNLLSTPKGRLTGFFCLYLSEGLPQGFTGTAVALEFKRMGMTGAAIGTLRYSAGPLLLLLAMRRRV